MDPVPQILLVDDEEGLRRIAQRALNGAGFSVITAADGQDALEVYAKHAASIRLIVTDITMPRLDGVGLHHQLRKQGVRVPFLFTSGYAAQDLIDAEGPGLIAEILEKPWGLAELVGRVRTVMSRSSGAEPET